MGRSRQINDYVFFTKSKNVCVSLPDLVGLQNTLGDQERLFERYWLTLEFSAFAFCPVLVHAILRSLLAVSVFLFFDSAIGLTIGLTIHLFLLNTFGVVIFLWLFPIDSVFTLIWSIVAILFVILGSPIGNTVSPFFERFLFFALVSS